MVEPDYSRWLFAHHAGRRGGPSEASWVALTVLLYGVSTLWRAAIPHLRQRRGLHLQCVRSGL